MATDKAQEAFGATGTGNDVRKAKKYKKWRIPNPLAIPEDDDYQCGMFGCKPQWLQLCNNIKIFLLAYVCLGIFKGMMHSYFGAVLPSIEKRFGFSSQSIGTVKSMNDISHILTALIIGHFGGAGHRPRWIAMGSFVVGLGFLVMAAPEILFPVTQHSLVSATILRPSDEDKYCAVDSGNASSGRNRTYNCGKGEQHSQSTSDHNGALIVLGVAEFLIGLGSTTTMVLGMPFVDDNVKASNAPLYYAISFCGHIFGPLLGLGFGAIFNSIFFNFSKPDFRSTDPRWISAWYLGFIISGLGTCTFALMIGCFPSAIPEKQKKGDYSKPGRDLKAVKSEEPSARRRQQTPVTIADLPKNLLRLAKNTTYIIKLCSQLISGFVLSGFMQFAQKFMKEQYQLPQATVNLQGGMPPIFAGFVGTLLGGFIVKRFNLQPRHVCYMMAATAVIGSSCYFAALALGCDRAPIMGIDDVPNPYNLTNTNLCAVDQECNCGAFKFDPVCDWSTRTTIVNSCVAGCKASQKANMTKYYFECSCVGNTSNFYVNTTNHLHNSKYRQGKGHHLSPVRSGVCPVKCPNFVIYVVLMSIAKLAMGIPMAGMLALQFRIVDYDLKSLANAVSSLLMALFGFLPAPIIVGRLIDSACRLWQVDSCGNRGACWIYKADEFRWKLHVAVGTCRLINMIFDLIVAYRVRNMTFDRDKDELQDSEDAAKTQSTLELVASSMDQDGGPELEEPRISPLPSYKETETTRT
ncbi:solute carrier organic anion transporter family member 2A1-like [Paramacrobiotus metropolitanus]|uniref:solute carrier organic anion transporter family member 2A1-like n=1 Tax=Paramacrobiotus metropolitanus TaxID=2943436 RepID=UPI0024464DCB|nr:solute carrier organic anion transporter family member 2A1-like [Paramacrobiotus metropolitanus]